ncbi:MAG: 50S ribosomal protein L11 methyltransferase [Leptolyngbyaceae cyanobacterium RU_5_1]|nr:50S ribosomal protein L11 methyltransferase [Leptolyngbyaceae cyanobacterium RU_5_1]
MTWMELSIDTTHEAVDWVSTLLAKTNYAGDVYITPYVDRDRDSPTNQPGEQPDWAFTIRLYLIWDARTNTQLQDIAHLLSPLCRTGLTTELQTAVVEEKPAHPELSNSLIQRVGRRFVVVPFHTPYQSDAADEITIRLGAALAFGSGFHPATILSLNLIERYVAPPMNVLDLGSGSGILSVAMAKLGAQVLALDNDKIAVQATQDAVCRNGIAQQVTVMAGSLGHGSRLGHWMGGDTSDTVAAIAATASFDLIAANILARMHIALANDFRHALRRTDAHTGILITAGYTSDYEHEVDAALMEAGFAAIDREQFNEWVALVHHC